MEFTKGGSHQRIVRSRGLRERSTEKGPRNQGVLQSRGEVGGGIRPRRRGKSFKHKRNLREITLLRIKGRYSGTKKITKKVWTWSEKRDGVVKEGGGSLEGWKASRIIARLPSDERPRSTNLGLQKYLKKRNTKESAYRRRKGNLDESEDHATQIGRSPNSS